MSQTYIEKSINCRECNKWLTKIIIKPESFEIGISCEEGHKHLIELNRKTGEIKDLIEKNEEN